MKIVSLEKNLQQKTLVGRQMLFILIGVWILLTPNAGQNIIWKCVFTRFLCRPAFVNKPTFKPLEIGDLIPNRWIQFVGEKYFIVYVITHGYNIMHFLQFFASKFCKNLQKTWKKEILSAQHPNAGRHIQQVGVGKHPFHVLRHLVVPYLQDLSQIP